jgi:ectoine hydroxylase-related dioxygenase (phytanoyl-CoA dioxygenase family)
MATEQAVHAYAIRTVTADEVAFYRENGWVKLERLIEPRVAGDMLAAAQSKMGERPDVDDQDPDRSSKSVYTSFKRGGKVYNANYWQDYHFIARDDQLEPMRSVVFSPALGRNAQLLMARDVPVRYSSDIVACKMPAGQPGSDATAWHQDIASLPFDPRFPQVYP